MSGRLVYDAVFDLNDYYPEVVRDDQRTEASIRETFVALSSGDWDFRLGRQNIIWGEMIGLFFADVVSAKDLREFVLPDFDYLFLTAREGCTKTLLCDKIDIDISGLIKQDFSLDRTVSDLGENRH